MWSPGRRLAWPPSCPEPVCPTPGRYRTSWSGVSRGATPAPQDSSTQSTRMEVRMSVLDEVRALGERALTEADELDSQARELITQAKALRAFARAAGIGVEPKPASTQPAGGRREVPGPVTQRKVAGAIGEHAAWLNGEPFTIAEVTGAAGLSAMSPVRAVMEHWRERGITGRAGMRGHSHLYRVLNPSAVMKVVNDDA